MASGGFGSGAESALLIFPEPLVPDLRLELAASKPYLVLSLPVHLLVYDDHLFLHAKSAVSVFVEPQWRPSGSEWRGVGGLRATQPVFDGLAVLVDAAGVIGTDGNGGLVGAGIGLFEQRPLHGVGFLALVWRHGFITHGQRDDFSIDLIYPIW